MTCRRRIRRKAPTLSSYTVTMDSALLSVHKIRGSQGGNDVSLRRCHLFPCCIEWPTCSVPTCNDERRVGRSTVGHSRCTFKWRSWLVLCAEFIYVLNLFKIAHLCTVFILSVRERLHITNAVIHKCVPPQKIVEVFGVLLSTWNTRQDSW